MAVAYLLLSMKQVFFFLLRIKKNTSLYDFGHGYQCNEITFILNAWQPPSLFLLSIETIYYCSRCRLPERLLRGILVQTSKWDKRKINLKPFYLCFYHHDEIWNQTVIYINLFAMYINRNRCVQQQLITC